MLTLSPFTLFVFFKYSLCFTELYIIMFEPHTSIPHHSSLPFFSSSSPQSDSQLSNKPKPRIAEEPLTGKPPSGNSRPASTSRRPPSKLARRPIKSSSANTPTAGQANTTGTSSSSSSTPRFVRKYNKFIYWKISAEGCLLCNVRNTPI